MSAPVFATPQEAEAAFYDAFVRADLQAMMEVWAPDDQVVCIHPGAPRMEGLVEVRESWRQIFASGARLSIELSDSHYTQDALLAIHQLREEVAVEGGPSGVVLATNIYQLIDGSWRMVLHHASPEPAPESELDEADGPSVLLH